MAPIVIRFCALNSAVGGSSARQQVGRRGRARPRCRAAPSRTSAGRTRPRARRAPRGSRAGARPAVKIRCWSPRKPIRRCPRGDQMRGGGERAAGVVAQHAVGVDERAAGGRRTRAPRRRRARRAGTSGRCPAGTTIRPSTRRDRNASASSRSRSASSSELPTSGSTPRVRATVSTPRSSAGVERVRDVVEDEPDARRRAVGATQVRRREVAPVAEQRDGLAHLLGEVGADAAVAR